MDFQEIKSELNKCSLSNSRKLAYTTQLFIQEEFLRRVTKYNSVMRKKEEFILTGLYSLYGRNGFPQKVSIPLEFEMRKTENHLTYIQEQIQGIINIEKTEVITFKIDYVKETEDIYHNEMIQAQIIGQIQRVKAPFVIKFYLKDEDSLKYKTVTYPVQIEKVEEPAISTVRLETIVAQNLVRILEKKDLLDSLLELYKITYIAINFSVNGRKIKDQLIFYKEKKETWFLEKDFSNIFYTRTEKNYQTKWKQFHNVLGEKETDFNQIIQLIQNFLGTIWTSIFDEIDFFGEWMPELNRYID